MSTHGHQRTLSPAWSVDSSASTRSRQCVHKCQIAMQTGHKVSQDAIPHDECPLKGSCLRTVKLSSMTTTTATSPPITRALTRPYDIADPHKPADAHTETITHSVITALSPMDAGPARPIIPRASASITADVMAAGSTPTAIVMATLLTYLQSTTTLASALGGKCGH